ncbi:MAG: TIGR03118 family protein [Hyperionvirus sp.]|uniref:TIGR03118 family protein n=1 Tax=Hyperionvirus sp. TaxID=2487770 RepID=A0A3G5A8T5_9VIRU|nr:MAG: TIGR03118 family protein [Hyperionvirus sp.]
MTVKIYKSKNLVANRRGFHAKHIDPELVNAYGMILLDNSLWVTANGTGKLIQYDMSGDKILPVVNISAAPTGLTVNDTIGFAIGPDSLPSTLLFSTADGSIGGYNKKVDPDNGIIKYVSGETTYYNGITLLYNQLYCVDITTHKIDVFGPDFKLIEPDSASAERFQYPPSQPKDYVVYNCVAINDLLYVTYVKKGEGSSSHTAGPGLGFIALYKSDGTFLKTIINIGNHLNVPYSITVAPENYGEFSSKLLVGNFGDGRITAYDAVYSLATYMNDCNEAKFLGYIKVKKHDTVKKFYINHLSTIVADRNTVFFNAGPNNGADGVVGKIEL